MQQTTVKFKIAPGGKISMEVEGVQGESCIEVTKELEVSLANAGAKQTDAGKKPEFYEGSGGIDVFNNLGR